VVFPNDKKLKLQKLSNRLNSVFLIGKSIHFETIKMIILSKDSEQIIVLTPVIGRQLIG